VGVTQFDPHKKSVNRFCSAFAFDILRPAWQFLVGASTHIMKPQDKAAKGLELIKEAILDCLEQHKEGIGNAAIASELGLQAGPKKFTRTLSWILLQQLVREKRTRSKGKGRARVYFSVGHNQKRVAG